jgi:hypothetical protein
MGVVCSDNRSAYLSFVRNLIGIALLPEFRAGELGAGALPPLHWPWKGHLLDLALYNPWKPGFIHDEK